MAAYLQKEISLQVNRNEETQIEELVEWVCDHYHIYNSYFGNIMMAVIESIKCNRLINNKNSDRLIIRFESVRKGLQFKVINTDGGFDFSPHELEEDLIEKTEDSYYKSLYLVQALSDEIDVSEDKTELVLVFGTASINKEMSVKRNEALLGYMKSGVKEKVEK